MVVEEKFTNPSFNRKPVRDLPDQTGEPLSGQINRGEPGRGIYS